MLGEYKVNRCTRRCQALNRPLRQGEWYYSVVLESGEEYARQDFSAESWKGPPEGTIGWWKSRMPTDDQKKMVLAPPEVLIDLLRQMEHFPAKAKSRYLLALMLMRRKLLRPADNPQQSESPQQAKSSEQTENPAPADSVAVQPSEGSPDAADRQAMWVEVIADGSRMQIDVCEFARHETDLLRDELNDLLYCEAGEPSDSTESDDPIE